MGGRASSGSLLRWGMLYASWLVLLGTASLGGTAEASRVVRLGAASLDGIAGMELFHRARRPG